MSCPHSRYTIWIVYYRIVYRPLIARRDVMSLAIRVVLKIGHREIVTNRGLPCPNDLQDDGAERASRSPSAGRTKRANSYELQEDQRTPNGSLRGPSLARSARGSNPDLEERPPHRDR